MLRAALVLKMLLVEVGLTIVANNEDNEIESLYARKRVRSDVKLEERKREVGRLTYGV